MADVQTTELLVVKWATPAEEALGMAKLAGAMVERRIAQPSEVAIVAPNAAWAENLLTACRMANVRATRLWPVEPGQAGRAVLAELDDLVANGGPDAPHGRTLIHRVGADAVPEFAHALLHLEGDESALEVRKLITDQLQSPTIPDDSPALAVTTLAFLTHPVAYLFAPGCVDGLVPPRSNQSDADDCIEQSRAAFARAVRLAQVRATISYFVKAPAELASTLNLHSVRTKVEDGRQLAMTRPTPFLAEVGLARPATIGGQALLRRYALN